MKKPIVYHHAKDEVFLRVVGKKDRGATLVVETRLGRTGRFSKSLTHVKQDQLTPRRGWRQVAP